MEVDLAFLKGGTRERRYIPDAEVVGDSIIIDCRGCGLMPVPGSSECIACMVGSMCRTGGAERVVLRTGKDTEISGIAGRMVKEVSSLRRWSIPVDQPKGRCRACPLSRQQVMSEAWELFPDGDVSTIRAPLASEVPDREECRVCTVSTLRALDQMEDGIRSICDSNTRGRVR